MKYIVYKITNNINSKVYIGQTTETIEKKMEKTLWLSTKRWNIFA